MKYFTEKLQGYNLGMNGKMLKFAREVFIWYWPFTHIYIYAFFVLEVFTFENVVQL
jgi:hypothetical protein